MKTKPNQTRLKRLLLPAILLTQFILIGSLAAYMYFIRKELNLDSNSTYSRLILSSVDVLNKEVKADPQTGIVYIHEAKLTLPPPTDSTQDLLYNYQVAVGFDTGREVRLVDQQNLSLAKNALYNPTNFNNINAAIPKLQACARGYRIAFKNISDVTQTLQFNKQLKDGRMIYVFSENLCSDNTDNVLPYIKQIESY